jgi:inosine/xanthosine triphosphate pyrophosphatase family protein/dephospho-CoA kinase
MKLAPILFSTSNLAKFMQARLMLSWHGLEVHRLESHGRPYVEPYGMPDKEFLMAGLDDVVSRAGTNRLVFIEDTTVEIPALSPDGSPYPGQQAKEWFAATTHDELWRQLKARGDNARAIVRSAVALHLPGLEEAVTFFGTTEGAIAERLEAVERNVLYPWLGQADFSSWFVPQGAGKALAAMELEESLRYDFRAKSLRRLGQRLTEYAAALDLPQASRRHPAPVTKYSVQPSLFDSDDQYFVLVVIGAIASGKTTIGHHLELHRGFHHLEGSRALREVARRRRLRIRDAGSNFDLADRLFEAFGHDVVERESILPQFDALDGPIAYTGCRTVEGLSLLKRAAREQGRRLCVLFVSAPANLRLSRAASRARVERLFDPLRFSLDSERDAAYGAARMKVGQTIADAHVSNKGNLSTFLRRVDEVVTALRMDAPVSPPQKVRTLSMLNRCSTYDDVVATLKQIDPELVTDGSRCLSQRGLSFVTVVADGQRPAWARMIGSAGESAK